MSSTHVRTILGALVVCAAMWLGPASATAAPRQVVTEYSGTLETSRPTRTAPPAEEPYEVGDTVDWAKENLALVIVVGGVVLVIATWKIASRAPKRRF